MPLFFVIFPQDMKNKIAIDFDGVVMEDSQGYNNGYCHGSEIKGAIETIWKLKKKGYEPLIFTTRADCEENIEKIVAWLCSMVRNLPPRYQEEEGEAIIEFFTGKIEITNKKPIGVLAYIDDRAIRFTSWGDVRKYFF